MALTGKAISQFSVVTSISTGTLFPVVDPTYPLATRNKTIALSDLVVSMPSIPNVVYQTGNQTISGNKTFVGTGVFNSNVGIGTGSPTSTLHVTGNIQIGRYLTNRADSQTPAGTNMVGVNAGNTGATNSNFFGVSAGQNATGASYSNFIGNVAGQNATSANYSNFLGANAGSNAFSASNSNFFGYLAGSAATNASYSNFFGYFAGGTANSSSAAINASYSNFIGYAAGGYPGYGTTAINASYSNFIGYQAGVSATNAKNSIFIGYNAGYLDSVNNTGNAGSSILIGDYTNTNGFSNSISIGRGTANSQSGQLNLGNVIFANGIGTGTSSSSVAVTTAKVGIGINTPAYTLDVNGSGSFKSGLSISGAFILTPIINSGSFTIGSNPFYVYTGASAGTGTMPSIGSSIGRTYFLKNRGAGTFTISGNSTDQFYYTGATTGSIPMANGQGFTVINDGTYWDVISKLI